MSVLNGATHVIITGGTQVAAATGSTVTINHGGQAGIGNAFKDLSAAAAHTALHDSSARFDAPRCHRNTRSQYLDKFERWMLGHDGEYAGVRLLWLTGGAGAGKSAIMQSIAERCAQHAVILGTFFFSRADPSRNYAEVLIPTLAYQLACAFPAAMAVLEPIIQRNPLIFKASLHTQAHELLVRPLLYLIETRVIDNTSLLRRVFIIDGLDECNDPQKQALIIHVVATTLCDYVTIPIHFIIASRPEMAISTAFQRETRLHSILTSITLDDNAESSSDIRQFVEDAFSDILNSHPLRNYIPLNWPDHYSVNQLVSKSSGHFVYAATAMKYISSTDEHPARALQVVEGLVPSRMGSPFAELDALYMHILTSAKYSAQVLGIVRHCILTKLDNSVKAVCFMYPNISPEDVALFLSDVQALVSLSPNNAAEMYILLKHASITDFLVDVKRSHALYMHQDEYKASLLPGYFRLLDNGPQVQASSLYCGRGGDFFLVGELVEAIIHSRDIDLLEFLIRGHSPHDVWNFCVGCVAYNPTSAREFAIRWVCFCVRAIRDSAAGCDTALYIHQFKMLIQVLMDDLSILVQTQPQYRIIPALIFSSSPRCLSTVVPMLIESLPELNIRRAYANYFRSLQATEFNHLTCTIDPRSYEAIRRLPQSQLSWGSDLVTLLEVVLRHLVAYSWTPERLSPNPHQRWLQKMKPLKHISQGSPKLSSNFYSYICRLPTPQPASHEDAFTALARYGYSSDLTRVLLSRREQCFVLLKTVVYYLHKSDCTSEIAKLARKSLPKAALWFPGLMKRARAAMDAYVLRWEESFDGLLEKAQSLSVNEMD